MSHVLLENLDLGTNYNLSLVWFCIQSWELYCRYHFAGSECKHYERRPYKNHLDEVKITRYIALANVGNKNKEKYLYAFNINPDDKTVKVPDDVTQCPFPEEKNEKLKKEQGSLYNIIDFQSLSQRRLIILNINIYLKEITDGHYLVGRSLQKTMTTPTMLNAKDDS